LLLGASAVELQRVDHDLCRGRAEMRGQPSGDFERSSLRILSCPGKG
jgi:hypothetical protein